MINDGYISNKQFPNLTHLILDLVSQVVARNISREIKEFKKLEYVYCDINFIYGYPLIYTI